MDNFQAVADAAEKIEGWMTREELLWLSHEAASRKLIIEVGSWKGRSTTALCGSTPGVVYAVDTWEGGEGFYDPYLKRDGGPDAIFRMFRENMASEICQNKCVCFRMKSDDAARYFLETGVRADMVFIDGNHWRPHIDNDIKNYRALLAAGGLLCGHDYSMATNVDVVRAVDELLPHRKVMEKGTIWYVA